jgi:beta-galactosidase
MNEKTESVNTAACGKTSMSIGVCYFPEHWPEDRWESDIEAMADCGIEYVRMGEFAWSRFEPEPGQYDTAWLERVVDLIGDHGMKAVLCTPTATPPKWLVDRYPEIRQTERDGTVREWGSRRHYCFNSETYRQETERIVTELADRFAQNPTVVGWQTDNEYGVHGTLRCYCDDCSAAFGEWLREKYGDVETLNETWGTDFWSQHHTSFDEIEAPGHTPTDHHPSRLLDYYRFTSDRVRDYNRLQADVLREANEEWFVTHNFMFDFTELDAFDVGSDLDFASWDVYPTGFAQSKPESEQTAADLRIGDLAQTALHHDLYRNAADGPFWIMEQQPGSINWPPTTSQPAEGAMRLWAHHAVAHGCDVVSYFRWRRCQQGQEQYHSGLRRADGAPDRGYHDAAWAADEFEELTVGERAQPDPSVAAVFDYESHWALEKVDMGPMFDYASHFATVYEALRGRGVGVDIVPRDADFRAYDAVVVPALHVLDDEAADRLAAFVRDGGSLLTTARTGEKTPGNQLHPTAPGPLADLVGATVDNHESHATDTLETTVEYDGDTFEYHTWGEWLSPDAAAVVGKHRGGVGDGRPAITHRSVGDGSVTYLGVWPDEALADAVVTDVLAAGGVDHLDSPLPDRVQVAERDGLTWVFNYGAHAVETDLSAGDIVVGDATVPAYDLTVFEGATTDITVEES